MISESLEGTFLYKNLCSSKLQKGFLLILALGALVVHNETCVLDHVKQWLFRQWLNLGQMW